MSSVVTSRSPAFRVAMIGLGHRLTSVALHLRQALPSIEFAGYVDPHPAGLARLQAAAIDPPRYADPFTMLRKLVPDAVMIGSPNHLHLEHIRLALEHTQAHVLCEKPVVRTEYESFALAQALAELPADRLIVGLVLRSLPVVKEALRLIRCNTLGTVTSLDAHEHLHPEHGGFLRRDWRRYRAYAGSYLLDKCCHDIDLMNAVTGSRPLRIASFAGTRIFTSAHGELDDGHRYRRWRTGWEGTDRVFDSDADTADVQAVMMAYENGAVGTFHSNTHLNPARRGWMVAGTTAAMDVDLQAAQLRLLPAFTPDDAALKTFATGSAHDHHGADPAMAQDLVATWIDGAQFPVSVREALVAGLVVMAADRAADTGAIVDLTETWERLDTLLA
jgi:predicted dehydrogenase